MSVKFGTSKLARCVPCVLSSAPGSCRARPYRLGRRDAREVAPVLQAAVTGVAGIRRIRAERARPPRDATCRAFSAPVGHIAARPEAVNRGTTGTSDSCRAGEEQPGQAQAPVLRPTVAAREALKVVIVGSSAERVGSAVPWKATAAAALAGAEASRRGRCRKPRRTPPCRAGSRSKCRTKCDRQRRIGRRDEFVRQRARHQRRVRRVGCAGGDDRASTVASRVRRSPDPRPGLRERASR
jgi:hypothetical protein